MATEENNNNERNIASPPLVGKRPEILYVDPSRDVASFMMSTENGKKKMAWNQGDMGIDLTIPPEDLCIFVDLRMEVSVGDNVASNGVFHIVWSRSPQTGTKGFFEGQKVGVDNILTARYEDFTYSTSTSTDLSEFIGIKSINVEFESWYIPIVNIEFVDIRGVSLMNPSQELKDETTQKKQQYQTAGSFFKGLFQIPYPLFKIQIKGFYGKPVVYDLHCNDVRTTIDTSTGNVNISAKFIGFTYAMWRDIPWNYIKSAPFMDYGNMKEYWDSKVSSGEFVFSNKQPLLTIPELLEVCNSTLHKINQIQKDSKEVKELDLVNSIEIFLGNIKSGWFALNSWFEQNFKNYSYSNDGKVIQVIITNVTNGYGAEEVIENILKVETDGISYFSLCKNLIEHVKIYNTQIESNSLYSKIELPNGMGENRNPFTFPLSGLNESLRNQICTIDCESFINTLNNMIELIPIIKSNKSEEIKQITSQIIQSDLKFEPTIGNILRIILAHYETAFRALFTCINNINNSKRKPIDIDSNFKINNSDIASKTGDIVDVPPFFKCITNMDSGKIVISPKHENSGILEPDKLEEVKFINDFIQSLITYNINFKSSYNYTGTASKIENNYWWIPINPFDISNKLLVTGLHEKNPYRELYEKCGGNDKDHINLYYAIGIRMFQALGCYSTNLTNEIVTSLANAEAINLFEGWVSKDKSLNNYISNIKNLVGDLYNMWSNRDYGTPTIIPYLFITQNNNIILYDLFTLGYCKTNCQTSSEITSFGQLLPFYITTIDSYATDNDIEFINYLIDTINYKIHSKESMPLLYTGIVSYDTVHGKQWWEGIHKTSFSIQDYTENIDNIADKIKGTQEVAPLLEMFRITIDHTSEFFREGRNLLTNFVKDKTWYNDNWLFDVLNKESKSAIYDNPNPNDNFILRNIDTEKLKQYNETVEQYAVYGSNNSEVAVTMNQDIDYLRNNVGGLLKDNNNFNDTNTFKSFCVNMRKDKNWTKEGIPITFFLTSYNKNNTEYNSNDILFTSPIFYKNTHVAEIDIHGKVIKTDLSSFQKFLFLRTLQIDDQKVNDIFSGGDVNITRIPKIVALYIGSLFAIMWNVKYKLKDENGVVMNYSTYNSKTHADFDNNISMFEDFLSCVKTFNNIFLLEENDDFKELKILTSDIIRITFYQYYKDNEKDIVNIMEELLLSNNESKSTKRQPIDYEGYMDFRVKVHKQNIYYSYLNINVLKKYITDSYCGAFFYNQRGDNMNIVTKNLLLLLDPQSKVANSIRKLFYEDVLLSTMHYNVFNPKKPNSGLPLFIDRSVSDSYLKTFHTSLLNLIKGLPIEPPPENQVSDPNGVLNASSFFEKTYFNFKKIHDRWLYSGLRKEEEFMLKNIFNTSNNESYWKESLIKIIDKYYCDISEELIVNLDTLKKTILKWDTASSNFCGVLSDLFSINNCLFIATPSSLNFNHQNDIIKAFTPIPYIEMPSINDQISGYTAVYIGTPSEIPNTPEEENFKNDTLDFNNKKQLTEIPNTNSQFVGKLPVFAISLNKQNNQYFHVANLSNSSPTVTEQTISATVDIAEKGGEGESDEVKSGQDLYDVYSANAYQCEVEMMGCAQIQPLMYFQLNNAYLFSGAYMIFKMSHQITPGTMKTSFTGIRQNITRTELTKDAYFDRVYVNSTAQSNYGLSDTTSSGKYTYGEGLKTNTFQSSIKEIENYGGTTYNDTIKWAMDELKKIGKEHMEPYWINIVGIRAKNRTANSYDDQLVYWYYTPQRTSIPTHITKFTTDPGLKALEEVKNTKGVAILKPGFYQDLWMVGDHRGNYAALKQVGVCTVYRDANKDGTLDMDESTIDSSSGFGINCHMSNPETSSTNVGLWSEGCQVFANPVEFNTFMSVIMECKKISSQKRYSYLLLDQT